MSNGTASATHTNGFARHQIALKPEEIAANWTCKKRDGKVVPFDCAKISKALFKCFNKVNPVELLSTDDAVAQTEKLVSDVVLAVVNTVQAQKLECPDVETVQRLVIAQLWGKGLFDAAEHYQNYREAHRKARLTNPVPAEVQARVQADQKHFPTDLQYYQFMSKFSKWKEEDRRRETWKEATYERVLPWLLSIPQVRGKLTQAEQQELGDAMYNLEASPAMRVVQMAGPALDRCNVGAYNCSYQPITDLFSFPEMLYILMQGTGSGFSVENEYVSELPRIKKQKGLKPETIVVEDDTESWCDSYHRALQLLFDGFDFVPDTHKVRRKGSRLKTKGGRASGPEPLVRLLTFARALILSKQGRFLEDIDCHDLACMGGEIVQVGGVRRAALISLSELMSMLMRNAKSGSWWMDKKFRSMANNSAVYDFDGPPPVEVFMEEWLALVKSKSGERGIFNRQAAMQHRPARRLPARFGCNPCAEIILRPWEFCNLSIVVARKDDTVESLKRKVRIAALFGKIQSCATEFRYIRRDWKDNCEEERLLGVDITGHADCPLLRFDNPDRAALLRDVLTPVVHAVDAEYSARFGVNRSAASTTVKPSGDSAVFFDCGSGVSPRFAKYQYRWVREGKNSPVSQFLIDNGVPYADAPENPAELNVFGFPRKSPEGAVLRDDMTAEQQFLNWLEWKKNWAEHSVSATIYVEDHEWPRLGALVYENIDQITGLAFLPKDNGIYAYSPNEELTEEQYNKAMETFPDLNWAKLPEYEKEDMTESSQVFACVGDKC